MNTNNKKNIFYIAALIILLLVIFIAAVCFGSVKISPLDIINALFGYETSSTSVIIKSIRLPRVIAGLLAGIGLSCSGVILQGILNNALASPNTVGVNSGAGFAVMLALLLFPGKLWATPVFAFLGALTTTIVIFLLAYIGDRSRMTIILAGIAISSFLSAGINLIRTLDTDISLNLNSFLVGSLSGVTSTGIMLPAIGIIVSFIITLFFGKAINILGLGDDVARSLGLRVDFVRMFLLVISSVLAGSVVSYAGLLSFAGLIIPHICRRIFGNDARLLIPCSALLGASFVMLCDLIGRVAFSPYELPAGILMSFVGGPFFLYLLLKKKGGRRVNA